MKFRPEFLIPPQSVCWGGLANQLYSGWQIAIIASEDRLREYVLVWNEEEDKFDLWQKVYTNPEDPSEHKYEGITNKTITNEVSSFFSSQDIWPIIEHCVELAKQESEKNDGQTD